MLKLATSAGFFFVLAALSGVPLNAQPPLIEEDAHQHESLYWIEPGPVETSVLYADGREIELQSETVTKLVCGSDPTGLTVDDVRMLADIAEASFAPGQPTWEISADGTRGGLNIVFSVSGGLPAGASAALEVVAQFIESQFTDPITVTINFSMFNFGNPGVIGSTSNSYAGSPSWTDTRNGLINGMDADDTIQLWLPTGSTIPVRYDMASSTVTNETRVFFTRANYNATIGTSTGSAATIQLNTGFSFDYDPSDGVSSGTMCFQSVLVHEVGHAMGFVSGADFRNSDIEALDVYRFQRSDGSGTNYNPDTLEQFQTTARMVDKDNGSTVDNVNSDLISFEYRMSDGNPYQASHFREQSFSIGIMDPALALTQTFYPNFYRGSDRNMFDAIGWDFVSCASVVFDTQPRNQTVDAGDPVVFTVLVSGTGPFTYQWRRNGANLSDGPALGGGAITGALTDTLTINPVGTPDEGNYDCVVTNGCSSPASDAATLTVNAGVPSAAVVGALSRGSCDLPVGSFNGAGPVASEPRQGGVSELRIAFDVAPAGPGASPVTIQEATCAAPAYAPYSGSSAVGASIAGNELVLTFTPGLENARTYRLHLGSDVTSLGGQFVEIRGLMADVNSDGLVNATDRSSIVGAWTGSGFTCPTDLNGDGATNATDRSIAVGAWTGSANCAP